MTLAKLNKRPSGAEIGLVRSWLRRGTENKLSRAATVELIRAVIENRMAKRFGKAPNVLRYFEDEMQAALADAGRSPDKLPDPVRNFATKPKVREALSDEERRLSDLVKSAWDDYAGERGAYSFSPGLSIIRDVVARGMGKLAERWRDASDGWKAAGRRPDLKPPDFSEATWLGKDFEEDLAECEEELRTMLNADG